MSFVVSDMTAVAPGCVPAPGGDVRPAAHAPRVSKTRPAPAAEPARDRTASVHRWYARVIRDDGPGILRMLWRMLGNEQDVLDAYQESWCLLAQLGTPRDVRSVRAYVYRTASNVAVEMIRRRKRRQGHWDAIVERYQRVAGDNEACGADVEVVDGDGRVVDVETLRGLVSELPPHLRNVIILRDLGGMKYREVGGVLGIDAATARVYRRQAILRLAELARHRFSASAGSAEGAACPERPTGARQVSRQGGTRGGESST
ncbi:MAG: RNA polymerase sigma factor [Phycisphaerales bacterium]|nr:MAG: RNA polymerase sigma factor [Phycisphaerales bacterium]